MLTELKTLNMYKHITYNLYNSIHKKCFSINWNFHIEYFSSYNYLKFSLKKKLSRRVSLGIDKQYIKYSMTAIPTEYTFYLLIK